MKNVTFKLRKETQLVGVAYTSRIYCVQGKSGLQSETLYQKQKLAGGMGRERKGERRKNPIQATVFC